MVGAAVAVGAQAALLARPPGGAARWERTNHRGRTVSLLAGPALALAATVSADLPRAAAAVACLGAGAVGAYDDVAGARDGAKGVRGHLRALCDGRVTAGTLKVVGIGAAGLGAAVLLAADGRSAGVGAALPPAAPGRSVVRDRLVDGAVVAASANLLNLLDLRPGRALKAGALAAALLGQPGPAAAAVALLPADLRERTMLGDAGANALGALLGLALVQRRPRRRGTALAALVAVNLASEVVSFSRVIDAVPVLRLLDRAGRRP